MRLLFTSPEIAVEGPYPYEKKYFGYLVRWAGLLAREDWEADEWSDASLGTLTQADRSGLLGPPPWSERDLFASTRRRASDRRPRLRAGLVRVLAAGDRGHPGRHRKVQCAAPLYAEKHLQTWTLDREALPGSARSPSCATRGTSTCRSSPSTKARGHAADRSRRRRAGRALAGSDSSRTSAAVALDHRGARQR